MKVECTHTAIARFHIDPDRRRFGWWCRNCGALNLETHEKSDPVTKDCRPHPEAWALPRDVTRR